MIITTTPCIDGRSIVSYEGVVFGEVITGINIFKDIGAGLRNVFGGRSKGYEDELVSAREGAQGGKARLRRGRRRQDGLRSPRRRQRHADGYVQRNRGKIGLKNSGSALLSCAS